MDQDQSLPCLTVIDDFKTGKAACCCSNPWGFINWRLYMKYVNRLKL